MVVKPIDCCLEPAIQFTILGVHNLPPQLCPRGDEKLYVRGLVRTIFAETRHVKPEPDGVAPPSSDAPPGVTCGGVSAADPEFQKRGKCSVVKSVQQSVPENGLLSGIQSRNKTTVDPQKGFFGTDSTATDEWAHPIEPLARAPPLLLGWLSRRPIPLPAIENPPRCPAVLAGQPFGHA